VPGHKQMVEGHQVHRVVHAHRKVLLGKAFKATSPNQRFSEGERKSLLLVPAHLHCVRAEDCTMSTAVRISGKLTAHPVHKS
jgi:hypothetical protein